MTRKLYTRVMKILCDWNACINSTGEPNKILQPNVLWRYSSSLGKNIAYKYYLLRHNRREVDLRHSLKPWENRWCHMLPEIHELEKIKIFQILSALVSAALGCLWLLFDVVNNIDCKPSSGARSAPGSTWRQTSKSSIDVIVRKIRWTLWTRYYYSSNFLREMVKHNHETSWARETLGLIGFEFTSKLTQTKGYRIMWQRFTWEQMTLWGL